MDRDGAIKAIKNGAIAACVSGGLTLAFVLFAIFSNASDEFKVWNDPSVFFDVILIFGCAYGIYKKSRFAAVFLFIYFILSKIYLGLETGEVTGVGVGLVFLYFYGKAVQGTYVFHKIEKEENPNYKPTPKWAYYLGIPTVSIFIILIGFGLITMTGLVPSTEVQAGIEMFRKDKGLLISNNIISKDDHIEYFYSYGFTSILEGGNVLTDNRVIIYWPDENKELQIYEIYFNDIASVELIQTGNLMNDSVYKVNSFKPDAWLQLELSTENRGDINFIEALRGKIGGSNP